MPHKALPIIIAIASITVAPHAWATEWTTIDGNEAPALDVQIKVIEEMTRRGFSEAQIEEARFEGQLIGQFSPAEIPTIAVSFAESRSERSRARWPTASSSHRPSPGIPEPSPSA